jgi:hypothetical protein
VADFWISGLAGHLARAVCTVERYLDTPGRAGPEVDAVQYSVRPVRGAPHDPVRPRIRERGDRTRPAQRRISATGTTPLGARRATRVAAPPADHPVPVFERWRPHLHQWLITRRSSSPSTATTSR